MHYSTYHYTHPELDHHYDDAHDVTPVPYHDHRVLKSVHSLDRLSYESMPYNEAKPQEDNPMHVSPLDVHYSIYHPTHRSLDHHYDDAHDVTPVPFHEHRVLKAVDPDHPSEFDVTASMPFDVHHELPYHHEGYHYYPNKANKSNKSSKSENWMPLHHAMPAHHNPDMHYSTYHYTHPKLDHHYDDAHDVTPVPFHEHAVLKSVHSPDRLSYESMTPYYERHHHYANKSKQSNQIPLHSHDMHYSTYHYTHPELDHHYDEAHDVTPVPFHEHAVLKAVHSPDRLSYESMTPYYEHYNNEAKQSNQIPLHSHDMHYSTYHYTYPELDHHYDDAHDVTPVPYHDSRVLPAVHSPDRLSYESMAPHYATYYNKATEPEQEQDSVVTAHHVRPEETAYEYRSGDHTMATPTGVPHSVMSHMPVYVEDHEDHHHEPPRHVDSRLLDSDYRFDHLSHRELDHKFDDAHDVTPVEFHEHRVLRAVPSHDRLSYESFYNKAVEPEQDSVVTAHHVRPEETAYEYHSGDHTMATPTAIPHPVMSHMPVYVEDHEDHHHEPPRHVDSRLLDHDYRFDHLSHRELDHKFDDAHDVTPVEFHEHRVLRAVPSHDRLSYESFYNEAAEPEKDSIVTAHHVHPEETAYEYHSGDHTMATPTGVPHSIMSHMPVYVEDHEDHHHEPPRHVDSRLLDSDYRFDHLSHRELDHKFDDAHDVTPVEFHEHRVLRAVPSHDRLSYESFYNEVAEPEKDSIVTAHHVHPEETAYEYHSGDHTMATPTGVPHSIMSHMPVYVEDHEDHHHEPPRPVDSRLLDPDYRFDHLSHR